MSDRWGEDSAMGEERKAERADADAPQPFDIGAEARERMTSWIPRVSLSLSLSGMRQGDLIGGKYRVEGVIGEGGMGIVLYAIHLDLERPVAIKVVRADLTDREEVISRMLLEARAAANIRSEHVARVLDVGRLDSGSPYIVMEYLEGCDLCTLLEHHGRLAPDIACGFIIQACEALAEAHTLGIVHRDLKPENLFLTTEADGEPIIKVLDFGISKELGPAPRRSITNASSAVGSPHYMAPEQMRAQPNIDLRVDIWALGAILFELVTGRPPFDAETLPAVCALVVSEEPPRARDVASGIPLGLDAVIWRCLRKDPAERYATVADLASALAPFGAGNSALSAERVSRISATTHRRSIMRLPMPSRDGSPLPRSLIPISVTPRGMNSLAAPPIARLSVESESVKSAPSAPRSRKAAYAAVIAFGVLLAIVVWTRPDELAASHRVEAAPPDEHAALPAVALGGQRSERDTPALAESEARADQKALPESPAEAPTPRAPAPARAVDRADSPSSTSTAPLPSRQFRSRNASRLALLPRGAAPGAPVAPIAPEAAGAKTAASPATPPADVNSSARAPAAAPAPTVDAWDPDRFGGRR